MLCYTEWKTIICETVSCTDEDKFCRESGKLSNANHGEVCLLYRHWRNKSLVWTAAFSHTAASDMQWVLLNFSEPWDSELWPSSCPTWLLMALERSQPEDTRVSWQSCKHLPRRGKCTHMKNLIDLREIIHLNCDPNMHFLASSRQFPWVSYKWYCNLLKAFS